jgi:2-polyprenyl-6-methoxyphenol hydroxylase-like FAD-dependent oxidoreductase
LIESASSGNPSGTTTGDLLQPKRNEEFDIIVIGGGPGGSTVGALLAGFGKRVLVLEKEVFPRYHIGESLLSGTANLMKKVGALEKIEASGAIRKYGVQWIWGSRAHRSVRRSTMNPQSLRKTKSRSVLLRWWSAR